MEFKLFLTSGMLDICSKKNKIVLIVPEKIINATKKVLKDEIILKPLNNNSSKNKNYKPKLKDKIEHTLRNILHFTYGKKANYENCISQNFQMQAFYNSQKIKGIKSISIYYFVIINALLGSNFKFYRRFIQKVLNHTQFKKTLN